MRSACILIVGLGAVVGRRFHDSQYHKHAHTYLQFCANGSFVTSHACVHKVSAKWPQPAVLDAQVCKEADSPYPDVGTNYHVCAYSGGLSPAGVNIYDPITIPQGLLHPNTDYRSGADVDTLTDWDRIRCRDGQLFGTGWYKKYTPQECARLCSKIHNFYGKSCTHFSRQWIQSKVPEHSDSCGRDGEELESSMPARGAWGSAGVGKGTYSYRGQCLFFNSPNNECCSTKAAWTESDTVIGGTGTTTDQYCQNKYGDREDAWNSKHRSWRLLHQAFTPTEAWPVTSLGRRLSDKPLGASGDDAGLHEFFLPNGTRFWAIEDEYEAAGVDEVRGLDEAMDAIEGKLLGEGTTVGARVQDALGHLLRSALSWFGY